jgi:hypothetical protein
MFKNGSSFEQTHTCTEVYTPLNKHDTPVYIPTEGSEGSQNRQRVKYGLESRGAQNQ